MKSKQLANILIKILGLSVIAYSIPRIITDVLNIVRFGERTSEQVYLWLSALPTLVSMVIGSVLIIKSREVAECIFKSEDDAKTISPSEGEPVEEIGTPCVSCGKGIPDGSQICPSCGWTQPG